MKCYFRSFDAGIGDCNIIRLVKNEGEQYVIMVDCGSYTEPLKEYLQNALHNHIDLLICRFYALFLEINKSRSYLKYRESKCLCYN